MQLKWPNVGWFQRKGHWADKLRKGKITNLISTKINYFYKNVTSHLCSKAEAEIDSSCTFSFVLIFAFQDIKVKNNHQCLR